MKKTHKGTGKYPYFPLCGADRQYDTRMRIRGTKNVDCKNCLKKLKEIKND